MAVYRNPVQKAGAGNGKEKAAAKSNASLGEQYLGALFKCASWISPAYKEMAEKARVSLRY